ncbi:MAG TPA: AtpZ/AtpI family protein [Thermodesulfobacteriota bacterium]|nr:AtpZ/AtpI family protein [Thermodesulfobacteriota bacterium]
MADKGNETFKGLLFLTSIGITLAASIIVGLVIGVYLDRLFSTKPLLTVIFIFFGAAAGFKNIYDTVKKYAFKNS